MNIKILREYVALCKVYGWEMNFRGLNKYAEISPWRREYIGNKVRV